MMSAIELPARLIDPLRVLARKQQSSVEEIVEELVDEYLREQRHQQLLEEMARFRQRHAQIVTEYRGRFIGMLDGQILDSDLDGGRLYTRLRQQYGDLPILIVQVNERAEQEFKSLSRRVEG